MLKQIIVIILIYGCAQMGSKTQTVVSCTDLKTLGPDLYLQCQNICKPQKVPQNYSYLLEDVTPPSFEEINSFQTTTNGTIQLPCLNLKNSCPLWEKVKPGEDAQKKVDQYIERDRYQNYLWTYIKEGEDMYSLTQESKINEKGMIKEMSYFGYKKIDGKYQGLYPLTQEQYFYCRQALIDSKLFIAEGE